MARPSTRSRVPDRTVPRQQGSLDALCGIYAIINAMRHLMPELAEDEDARLFAKLVRRLEKVRGRPLKGVWRGLKIKHMRRLARHACKAIARATGIELRTSRVKQALRKRPSLAGLWGELRDRLQPGTVAIIGIGGLEAHWSVAVHVGRSWLKLIDSDGLTALKRSGCSVRPTPTRHVLDPSEIILISRRTG